MLKAPSRNRSISGNKLASSSLRSSKVIISGSFLRSSLRDPIMPGFNVFANARKKRISARSLKIQMSRVDKERVLENTTVNFAKIKAPSKYLSPRLGKNKEIIRKILAQKADRRNKEKKMGVSEFVIKKLEEYSNGSWSFHRLQLKLRKLSQLVKVSKPQDESTVKSSEVVELDDEKDYIIYDNLEGAIWKSIDFIDFSAANPSVRTEKLKKFEDILAEYNNVINDVVTGIGKDGFNKLANGLFAMWGFLLKTFDSLLSIDRKNLYEEISSQLDKLHETIKEREEENFIQKKEIFNLNQKLEKLREEYTKVVNNGQDALQEARVANEALQKKLSVTLHPGALRNELEVMIDNLNQLDKCLTKCTTEKEKQEVIVSNDFSQLVKVAKRQNFFVNDVETQTEETRVVGIKKEALQCFKSFTKFPRDPFFDKYDYFQIYACKISHKDDYLNDIIIKDLRWSLAKMLSDRSSSNLENIIQERFSKDLNFKEVASKWTRLRIILSNTNLIDPILRITKEIIGLSKTSEKLERSEVEVLRVVVNRFIGPSLISSENEEFVDLLIKPVPYYNLFTKDLPKIKELSPDLLRLIELYSRKAFLNRLLSNTDTIFDQQGASKVITSYDPRLKDDTQFRLMIRQIYTKIEMYCSGNTVPEDMARELLSKVLDLKLIDILDSKKIVDSIHSKKFLPFGFLYSLIYGSLDDNFDLEISIFEILEATIGALNTLNELYWSEHEESLIDMLGSCDYDGIQDLVLGSTSKSDNNSSIRLLHCIWSSIARHTNQDSADISPEFTKDIYLETIYHMKQILGTRNFGLLSKEPLFSNADSTTMRSSMKMRSSAKKFVASEPKGFRRTDKSKKNTNINFDGA